MFKSTNLFTVAFAVVSATTMLGCGDSPSTGTSGMKPKAAEPAHSEGDGHDHAAHAHPTEGPHHGQLIELGQDEYHVELVNDEDTKTVTVYLLDGAAKKSVPIADKEVVLNLVVDRKPQQVKLAGTPQNDDPKGQSSKFSLKSEPLHEALEAESTKGRINVTIAGKSYTGQIVHVAHNAHAGHDHK